MPSSKKFTEYDYPSGNVISANTLFLTTIDPDGTPATHKINAKQVLESNIAANAVFVGPLTANAFTIRYAATPASNIAVPSGFANNTMWTDGDYIYVVTDSGGELKRIELENWNS